MNIHLKGFNRGSGFTLIEMAIVLVIVITVLTLGLGALTSVLTSSAYAETKARQARISDALTAYFGANKRLPCPAWGSTAPTAIPDMRGVERKDAAGICIVDPTTTTPQIFGVVPYATLGIGRDVAEDGWGGLISYQPYATATGSTPSCLPETGNDWTKFACFGAGKTGGIEIAEGAPPTIIASGVVAVLVSHGPNGLRAWIRQGTRNANPLTCDEAHNSLFLTLPSCNLTANRFFKGERSENDDVVRYLTADDIIQALAKQGAILSATARVSEDLRINMQDAIGQVLVAGSEYSSVPTLTINRDPWGNPYQIASNISTISNLGVVTLNTGTVSPICIYSLGRDGINGVIVPPATTTPLCTVATGGDDIVASVSSPALTAMFTNKACSPSC